MSELRAYQMAVHLAGRGRDVAGPLDRGRDEMIRPTIGERIQFWLLIPQNCALRLVGATYRTFLWALTLLPPGYMASTSRIRARHAFYRAARSVPAYTRFLRERGATRDQIPETDKDSYIRRYATEERCVGGRIPTTGTMIDESSGSTGTPYNWVRSPEERRQSHLFVSYFATYCFGEDPFIAINAFSQGAWATGLNMGLSLQRNGIVKNTGPDIAKILHTLRFFGPRHPYLITGYPPFLKHLLDGVESQGFPLRDYRLDALVGGEGMSEGLRDYLLRYFRSVYSGYGATDLEIGIAGETPVSVAIRRLARENEAVRRAVFGADPRLPMIFQYNPLMHHIEVNEKNEVIFTITRGSLLSPRIRYNVHDEGGVARFDELAARLASAGVDIWRLVANNPRPMLRLPFLWIYGRRDYTISIMGANIYPEDLEQSLYAAPELARITRSFCLSVAEGLNAAVRPCFCFELEQEPDDTLRVRFAEAMLEGLRRMNADFRDAWKEYPETLVPEIRLYRRGDGPFASDAARIKQVRFLARAAS